MAKRFTDTEKWKDDWYLSIDNDTRIIYQWLLDNCNHSGMIKKEFAMLNYCCRTDMNEERLLEMFKDRVVDCGSFFFLPKFIGQQYPKGLNSDKPAVKSARSSLEKFSRIRIIRESLDNHYTMIKDKDKDKDKDKKGSKQQKCQKTVFGFDAFWETYPKKVNKAKAEKDWEKIKPNEILLEAILKAVSKSKESDAWIKDGGQFIPHPSSWLNGRRWEDDITPLKEKKMTVVI